MRDCDNTEMRDLLPAHALGTLASADRARVEAHLAGCDACRAEVALLRAVHAAHPAPRVDVARIVAALPRPAARPTDGGAPGVLSLDAHRGRRAAARGPLPWRRVAAMAAVLVGVVSIGVIGTRTGVVPDDARAVAPLDGGTGGTASAGARAPDVPSPGARSTNVAVAGESARAVVRPGANGAGAVTRTGAPTARPADALGTLGGVTSDVTDDELEALLAGLESLSGIPVVEESDAVDGGGGDA